MGALSVYVGIIFSLAWRYAVLPEQTGEARCEVRDGWFYRGGEKFLVKAVGYDPARPGELPWARERSRELLDEDFAGMRAAGFNTVRTWEPLTKDELSTARRHGLAVIQGVWVDPEGDFADPAFRKAAVERVAEVARGVQGHPATVAWLVMNEPRPATVLAEGLEPTRLLLRELAQAVRANDPGVPVGFASWPGLEMLDEPSLDFVAANLYPFRPGRLLDSVGYAGMVRLWKQELAGSRPLLVSEFGISVAPGAPAPDAPGGVTEAEQGDALPRLADDVLRAGAAGEAVFMWNDGWWKNAEQPGDEQTHDPNDGEEWFGLHAMDTLTDDAGRPRPALEAMRTFNRAVLTLPADGPVATREIEIEAHVEEPGALRVEASINGAAAVVVPTVREGPWVRGRMGLLASATGAQRVEIAIFGPDGGSDGLAARFERVVVPVGEGPTVELSAGGEGEGRSVTARVLDVAGKPAVGVPVRLALSEPTRRFDKAVELVTDAAGEARLEVYVPSDVVLLATAAVREGQDPPLALDTVLLGLEGR